MHLISSLQKIGVALLNAQMYSSMDDNSQEPEWFKSPVYQELFVKLCTVSSLASDMFVGRERFTTLLLVRLTKTVILLLSDEQSFWEEIEHGQKPLGPFGLKQLLEKVIQRSFLVSADMAHALHPNYMDKHDENHQPKLHSGLVIKHNANQRYATNAVTAFIFWEIAANHNLPVQDFVVRNNMPCGSTIGPILASGTGIRTVDITT